MPYHFVSGFVSGFVSDFVSDFISGYQRVTLRPADASKQCLGENLTKLTFSTCENILLTSCPSLFQICTTPFSLPEMMKLESGEKLHSIIDDSLRKFVILQIYVLSKASNTTMLLSEVARSSFSPLLLNLMIFISL